MDVRKVRKFGVSMPGFIVTFNLAFSTVEAKADLR